MKVKRTDFNMVELQAVRWDGDNLQELKNFTNDSVGVEVGVGFDLAWIRREDPDFSELQPVKVGQWIVKENDVFCIWNDDQFRQRFEVLE